MSAGSRRGPPRNDAGGRLLLAVLSIVLIAAGIARSGQFAGLPLILLGVLLAILCAFHSRVRGVKIFDKVQLPIAAQSHDEPQEIPSERAKPEVPEHNRPVSLGEIGEAARNPATERRRSS